MKTKNKEKLRYVTRQLHKGEVIGPLTRKAQMRPLDFYKLAPETQWAIDKNLGILDWSGNPTE